MEEIKAREFSETSGQILVTPDLDFDWLFYIVRFHI